MNDVRTLLLSVAIVEELELVHLVGIYILKKTKQFTL